MPGILMNLAEGRDLHNQIATIHSSNEAKTRSQAMSSAEGHSKLTNGVNGSTNHASMSQSTSNAVQPNKLPEEITHIVEGYQPLSKLVSRIAQTTFNDLSKIISELAEIPGDAPVNGDAGANPANADGSSNLGTPLKKLRLLEFAQEKRAELIKVLVLSKWSRRASEISRVIDIKVWLDGQIYLYDEAAAWMGELKRSLSGAKVPNPDLITAVEALSSGRVASYPNLGYIKPKPLKPQEILKTLRSMNASLSIRLCLHETIPPHFNDYTIGSGRATFRVPYEFELDLSIADEDPESQLYFIDFRFLFTPCCSRLPAGRLLNEFENKINDILKTKGLSECYDFLHNFVLTQKINILRLQGLEMTRGRWTRTIGVSLVRRTLVVQYWLDKPGPKSWIEIGISSGRRKPRRPFLPYLNVRWRRDGDVFDFASLEFENLSLEGLLDRIVNRHRTHILRLIYDEITKAPLYEQKLLSAQFDNSCFTIELTKSRSLTFSIEPISGRVVLTPVCPAFVATEERLNGTVNVVREAVERIKLLRCTLAKEEVDFTAQALGWEFMRIDRPLDELKKLQLFPQHASQVSFYRGPPSWPEHLIFAFTTGMTRDDFWLVDARENGLPPRNFATTGIDPAWTRLTYHSSHLLPLKSKGTLPKITYTSLSHIQNATACMISLLANTKALADLKIKHAVRPDAANQKPVLYMELKEKQLPSNHAWVHGSFRSSIHDMFPPKSKHTSHLPSAYNALIYAEAQLEDQVPFIDLLVSSPPLHLTTDQTVYYDSETRIFTFPIIAPISKPVIYTFFRRLNQLSRLIRFLNTLHAHSITPSSISLTSLTFAYSSPPLHATVSMPPQSSMSILFPASNPHVRIKDVLSDELNRSNGLSPLTTLLDITLPLMRSFDALEHEHADHVSVFVRTAKWYVLAFWPLGIQFGIFLKERRDTLYWEIRENKTQESKQLLTANQEMGNTAKEKEGRGAKDKHKDKDKTKGKAKEKEKNKITTSSLSSALLPSLDRTRELVHKLFREKAEHWFALGEGVVCKKDGIGLFLQSLRDCVLGSNSSNNSNNRKANGEEAAKTAASTAVVTTTTAATAGKAKTKAKAKATATATAKAAAISTTSAPTPAKGVDIKMQEASEFTVSGDDKSKSSGSA